jgi:cytochrome P450
MKAIEGLTLSNFIEVLGLVRQIRADMLGSLNRWSQQYGDTFGITVGNKLQIQTSDPEFVHEVLVKQSAHFIKDDGYTNKKTGLARFFGNGILTSNGDFWKRQRKLVAPALHTKRIDSYAETIVNYGQDQIATWRDGQTIPVAQHMNELTMRIIAKTMFSTDVRADVDAMREALLQVQNFFMQNQMSPLPSWLPTPSQFRSIKASRALDGFVYGTIATWHTHGQDKGDLLSMLLLARDEDDKPMTDEQARDEVLTLFLAGFETTANTLNWTWMLLAQHPHIAQRLHQELDSVLGGQAPTLADLRRLPYTEMVIKESMRLYPPAHQYGRQSTQELEINGYLVPKNTVIGINVYRMHRREDLWQDAGVFLPERWAKENEANIPPRAYLPFGNGPRVCVGNAFAMMEACLLLATIASRYELHLAPNQRIDLVPAITLNPKGNLPMTVHQRTLTPISQPTTLEAQPV